MLSKLKSMLYNPFWRVDEGTETVAIQKSTWKMVSERAGRYSTLEEQNIQLRSKIDEADHIIRKQKETIMSLDKHGKQVIQTLTDQRLPTVPIKLRTDFLVTIAGLPMDLTPEEAQYISGILASYALRPELAMDALHASEPNGIGK